MKKLISIFIVLALCLSMFCACGKSDEEPSGDVEVVSEYIVDSDYEASSKSIDRANKAYLIFEVDGMEYVRIAVYDNQIFEDLKPYFPDVPSSEKGEWDFSEIEEKVNDDGELKNLDNDEYYITIK